MGVILVTIREWFETANETYNIPTFDAIIKYVPEYESNIKSFNMWVVSNYGTIDIINCGIQEDGSQITLNEKFREHCLVHDWEYEKLQATLELEYNPIWNVDGIEKEHTARLPNLLEHTGGSNDYGQHVTTNLNTYGNKKSVTDNKIGQRESNTEDVNGFKPYGYTAEIANGRPSFASREKDVINRIDEATQDSTTITEDKVIDNLQNTSQSHKDTYDETKANTGQEDIWFERIRTGNIGVTKTQELIQSERDISHFSLFKYIIEQFCAEMGIVGNVDSVDFGIDNISYYNTDLWNFRIY